MYNEQAWKDEFQRFMGMSFSTAQELLKQKNNDFMKMFQARTGIPYEHANIRGDTWRLGKWNEKEFYDTLGKITYGKHGNFANKLGKLILENDENPGKTLRPIELRNPIFNILLLGGLTESAKRDTNEVTGTPPSATTGIDWIGVGTDGTAESQSQTGLIAAYGSRKQFSVSGQRKVTNQTANYNMLFSDSDLTVPVILKEAVLYNLSSGGTAHARVQYPDFALAAGQIITFQVKELMANG